MHSKIINFCPTGVMPTRENSFAPLNAPEIIEEVHEAYELGISVVHIHARDKELNNTYESKYYLPIIEGIRKHCPDLMICASLSGRFFPEFEKRSEVLQLKPDMGSLTMSSLNFPTGASNNSPAMIMQLIQEMEINNIVPEIECFDSGMLNYTKYLISKGYLHPPYYINMIFGNISNAQADLPTFASISKPDNSIMCFGGIGKDQLKCNVIGLMYADGVRIGLEDNLHYKEKDKAKNIDLLIRIHAIMEWMNYSIMTPKEFKAKIKN